MRVVADYKSNFHNKIMMICCVRLQNSRFVKRFSDMLQSFAHKGFQTKGALPDGKKSSSSMSFDSRYVIDLSEQSERDQQ